MRKLLFVHDERYLNHAIRNVQELLGLEHRLSEGKNVSDLLAVLLMSPQLVNELLSQEQEFDLPRLADRNSLFSPDSVSVNGLWILVTLSRLDLQEPRTRHEALDRVLDILQTLGFVQDSATVFPVSPSEEPYLSIREQMTFLKNEQPSN
jgi:hypothetical protein